MQHLYSIGEVAKKKDITIKALRYYHKMGILVPRYTDEATGYRYYAIDQLVEIDIIKSCRALGTSIKELQEIFQNCHTEELMAFMQRKRKEALENIEKMQQVITHIDQLTDMVVESKKRLNTEEILIQIMDERYMMVVPCEEVGELKEVLYYSELEKKMKKEGLQPRMERGIFYKVRQDGKAEPCYVFNEVEEMVRLEERECIKVLPRGKYVTLAYQKENEEVRRKKLTAYLKKHQLQVKEIIEIELINDFFNTKTYSCQIQVLIEVLEEES